MYPDKSRQLYMEWHCVIVSVYQPSMNDDDGCSQRRGLAFVIMF